MTYLISALSGSLHDWMSSRGDLLGSLGHPWRLQALSQLLSGTRSFLSGWGLFPASSQGGVFGQKYRIVEGKIGIWRIWVLQEVQRITTQLTNREEYECEVTIDHRCTKIDTQILLPMIKQNMPQL